MLYFLFLRKQTLQDYVVKSLLPNKIRIWQIFISAQILYLSEKILNKIRLQRQLKQKCERLNNVL